MFDSLTEGRGGLVVILIVVVVLATVLLTAVLVFKLLTKFRLVHDQLAPFGVKAAFWGALAYTVLPLDLLPDPLMLDDIGALVAALLYINSALRGQAAGGSSADGSGNDGDNGDESTEIIGR